ncbi:acyltransferase family protein, partial [Nesterenkonia sp. F]|uniref:acyltransferase family protein n=1 Tax=Nesterenkonia sp. F TaxID=795955 RepID=UPI000255C7DD
MIPPAQHPSPRRAEHPSGDAPEPAPSRSSDSPLAQGLPPSRYRPELHGVRGLSILGVVLFHLFGDGRVSGGIDIFLAITGFLFTGMLLRESASRGGPVDVGRYLARLARRILPPAALVVAATAAAGLVILPETQHRQLLAEARASLLYVENHELIASQLAYEAAGPQSSPFQHFWSLSVQGQFYLIWPVLAVLSVLIARRLGRPAVHVMAVGIALVVALSFGWALHMHATSQAEAYLMTSTRLWELAFGGLVALLGTRLSLPRVLRAPAGWLGLVLILACGFVLDGAALFPGPWALWPLLGLTLVLASAGHDQAGGDGPTRVGSLLSSRPPSLVADHAYCLYLWHWPVLIMTLELLDLQAAGAAEGAVVLAISAVLAWATRRWVELPAARLGHLPVRIPLAAGGVVLVGGGAALTVALVLTQPQLPVGSSTAGVDAEAFPGARVTATEGATSGGETPDPQADGAGDLPVAEAGFLPAPTLLADDEPAYYGWDCRQPPSEDMATAEVTVCEDPDPPASPTRTIMIAGGSHAGQWQHAWRIMADAHEWELIIADKSGCRLQSIEDADVDSCAAWNRNFIDVVADRAPDLVVTAGTVMDREEEFVEPGSPDQWRRIVEAGSEVLL